MPATFTILSPGRTVELKPFFQKGRSWKRGRIVKLISPIEKAILDGGYYGIEPIGGSEYVQDLVIDMHRSSFVPVSNSKLAKALRAKREKAKQ